VPTLVAQQDPVSFSPEYSEYFVREASGRHHLRWAEVRGSRHWALCSAPLSPEHCPTCGRWLPKNLCLFVFFCLFYTEKFIFVFSCWAGLVG
jgi:hypothetical protein